MRAAIFIARPKVFFVAGQIALSLCLLGCVVAVPRYFFSLDQGGISNYGTEPQTVGLYAAGFGAAMLGCTGALVAARSQLGATSDRFYVQVAMAALAALYLLVMLSTFSYKADDAGGWLALVGQLHENAAMALFLTMFVGAFWLRFAGVDDAPHDPYAPDPAAKWAFLVFCAGFAVGTLTLVGYLHLLFTAQILCGATFGLMMARRLARSY